MATNLYTVITRDQAIASFEEYELPSIQQDEQRLGHIDYVARSEAWSNYVDSLWQNRQISDWQLEHWEHPDCTEDQ
tara:strand:+ start:996 stop:1223 length:228 start_codon:yes stop_codon:yes gene_type:complete